MKYPLMVRVRQYFKTKSILTVSETVKAQIAGLKLEEKVEPGQRVAITAGSRGVANIAEVTAAVVSELKRVDARPFIIPAMGSHGGATAEGQKRILEYYGITEDTMDAPIRNTMEVVQVGTTTKGVPVYVDKYAYEADHIVVINRIKPHTDFQAPIESGLMKMMAIGLGKHKGADCYHNTLIRQGHYDVFTTVAREILKRCPILFGLGLVENQKDETEIIRAIPANEIEATEEGLLETAKEIMPKIPFKQMDILIIDYIGKEISGTGMDQNVIARTTIPFASVPTQPEIKRIFVRDLTKESLGNAVGIGNADFTTARLVGKINRKVTYTNLVTACAPEMARIPMYFDHDRQALEAALKTIGNIEPEKAKIVHIRDTLRLNEMEISEALLPEAKALDHVDVVGSFESMRFDGEGNFISDFLEE